MNASMTISKKIYATCGVMIVAIVLQAAVALYGFSNIKTAASDASGATAQHVATLGAMAGSSFLTLLLVCLVSTAAGVGVAAYMVGGINGSIRELVGELGDAAGQIASAAGQVESSSQSMAHGSSQQAATIQETSAASSEINSMAQRNTENSRTTADMVTKSQAQFQQTNQSLEEMVEAMDGITSSSQKISKIIKVIDEIAFQTNILALNAAVEAARAGEAGMGFAVVADEVRNLAQRCAQAAKDTSTLIEDSIQKSHGGKAKVDQVAGAIRSITAESAKMKILVDEINLGSVEQARGIDQITRSISQIEQVTQSTAASAEQSAGAAQELNAQAHTMQDVVGRMTVLVDGSSLAPQRTDKAQLGLARSPPARSAAIPKTPAARPAAVASFKSAVSFAAPKAAAPLSSARSVPAPSAPANEFPMDDDFKEF